MHYPPGGHTARKNVVRDAKHVRNDPKHDPRSAQADIARRHQTRDRSGTRTTRTHENDGNGRPNKHAKPHPAGIIGQRVLGGQTTQLLPAISAPLQSAQRERLIVTSRARPCSSENVKPALSCTYALTGFERAMAGSVAMATTRALTTPLLHLWETTSRKVAKGFTYLCGVPFSARGEAHRRRRAWP